MVVLGAFAAGSRSAIGPQAPGAVPTASATASVAAPSWTGFGGGPGRSGEGPAQPSLARERTAWSATLDGLVYASPVGAAGLVVAATENDSVYALEALTGRVRWRVHVGEPVAGHELSCGDIDPSGITSTPVIDEKAGLVYVVGLVQPAHHQLFALELGSGRIRFQRGADRPGANPLAEQQRGALTISRGNVYIPYGGLLGDCSNYRGSVVGVRADGGGELMSWTVPAPRRGGIWAAAGPLVDTATGDLLVATGNTDSTTDFDFGNAVVRLSPDLKLLDWFAPTNWAQLNRGDTDLGSASPGSLGNGLLLQVGKDGVGYALRADHLGQLGGSVISYQVCRSGGGGSSGGTAFAGGLAYVPCGDGMAAIHYVGSSLRVHWRSAERVNLGPPVIAYGAVWSISAVEGTLYGFDPASGATTHRISMGGRQTAHFVEPAAIDGLLLVPIQNRIAALGPATGASAPAATTSSSPSR